MARGLGKVLMTRGPLRATPGVCRLLFSVLHTLTLTGLRAWEPEWKTQLLTQPPPTSCQSRAGDRQTPHTSLYIPLPWFQPLSKWTPQDSIPSLPTSLSSFTPRHSFPSQPRLSGLRTLVTWLPFLEGSSPGSRAKEGLAAAGILLDLISVSWPGDWPEDAQQECSRWRPPSVTMGSSPAV